MEQIKIINLIKMPYIESSSYNIDCFIQGELYYGVLLKRESNLGEQHEIA